jgi:DNA-directed RNA polymerase subunit K/omega
MRPAYSLKEDLLNAELLKQAKTRVPSIPILVNMVSKRVAQLNAGFRPYVKPSGPEEERLDIALREIAEGKLIAEIDFAVSDKEEKTEI